MRPNYVTRRVKRIWQRLFPKPIETVTTPTRCRQITPDDLDAVINLLEKGFWRLSRDYWVGVIHELTTHATPEGYPKYGNLLENDGKVVGVLLLIFTKRVINGETSIWCCGSSFYIEPAFRAYAPFMIKRSHRYKGVTYLELTTLPSRLPTIERDGYRRIAKAAYMSLPILCRPTPGVCVHKVTKSDQPVPDDAVWFAIRQGAKWTGRLLALEPSELQLLTTHARYKGCVAVVCEHDGMAHPFVFVLRRRRGLPFAYLIYRREHTEYAQFAGALGRFFAKRGIFMVALDVNDRIAVPGWFTNLRARWWNGPEHPPVGDLAYTEIPMFGSI
jgi:hypothetical protein